jgi:hypothetical protein
MGHELRKMTGRDNRQQNKQWRQLGTTSATVTVDFWLVSPVNGDAVLSVLNSKGPSGIVDELTSIDSATKTFYQDVEYPGSFTQIRVTSGEVIIYLRGR